jgi:hypothetical protein
MCLMNAGQNRYNLRQAIPVEVAPGVLLQPERMGVVRSHVNQVTQIILRAAMADLYASGRSSLREAVGLPARVGPGLFSVPPGVARVVNIISCLKELVRACCGGAASGLQLQRPYGFACLGSRCGSAWVQRAGKCSLMTPRLSKEPAPMAAVGGPRFSLQPAPLPPSTPPQEIPGRPVPPEWHLVAPQGVVVGPGGRLPEVQDPVIQSFLDRAAGVGGT